ncbi:hypothetical protein DSECCO2_356420 [anaerobic digester metagenome]
MKISRMLDMAFILLSFGIYILLLNTDKQSDNYGFFIRHLWLTLILAYYAGRGLSAISGRLNAGDGISSIPKVQTLVRSRQVCPWEGLTFPQSV